MSCEHTHKDAPEGSRCEDCHSQGAKAEREKFHKLLCVCQDYYICRFCRNIAKIQEVKE